MLKLIAIGKIKETFLRDAIQEYLKRFDKVNAIQIIELKEETSKTVEQNMILEGESILSKISSQDYVITLEIMGEMLDSVQLAKMIAEHRVYATSDLVFVIGGSNGLADVVKKRSNFALSFSRFTFPHQLMRLILIEQLYRSMMINNHQEYHK